MSEPDESETRSRATTTWWSRVILAGLLLAGLGRAAWLRWVCDDAFISFRYARNLVAGHGLVWNVGERVEGFTNPLWTFAIAGGLRAGLDPIVLSQMLGLASYAILLGALWRLERSVAPGAVLPLATAVCALLPNMAE